jgi:hypothetical protein
MLPSSHKLTLGLLATVTSEIAPFHMCAPFLVLLQFFKCTPEVVSFEGVQHCLLSCIDHLNCVKMAAFQFYRQLGKQRKVEWVKDDNRIVFGKKNSGGKGV